MDIYSVLTSSIGSAASRSVEIELPTAGGTRVYAFVHAGRSSPTDTSFTLNSATLGGNAMSLVDSLSQASANRLYREYLYEVIDPLDDGGNPTTQTLAVTFSRNITVIGLTVVIVTGVVERGAPVSDTVNGTEIAVNVTTELFPGIVLAGGHVRRRSAGSSNNYDDLAATDDAVPLTKYATGTTDFTDLAIFAGSADADAVDTYTMGWSWPASDIASLIALPLYGAVEVAEAEFSALDPDVVIGTATLDGLLGEADFSGIDPEVILGSIPPVQVIGKGQLYLSTSAQNITVLLLATAGELWTIADAADAVEQLGLMVTRRKGYLTPM